jgi:hypothetical protein
MLKVIGVETVIAVGLPGKQPLFYYEDPRKAERAAAEENSRASRSVAPVSTWPVCALKAETENGQPVFFELAPIKTFDRS